MNVIWVHTHLEEAIGHINCPPDFPLGTICQDVIYAQNGVSP